MNPPAQTNAAPSGRVTAACALLLAAAIAAAWSGTFGHPLVFDDIPSLRDNASIRQLGTAWFPPTGGLTVSGRPLLNLTFALNYALSGEAVWSYHAVNLCIHFLAALTLFGLVRRTLRLPVLAERLRHDGDWLALAVALLWAVHPLQTESVTYLVQRAESLAGLFYLLTLYGFARSAQSDRPGRWLAASAVAGLLGACTKETVATAPLLILLYDRTFVSGSFRAAWARHRVYYGGLALGWLVLAGLVLSTHNRGGTTGFDTPMTAMQYALIQLHALAHYLRLACWPQPLVFDNGPFQTVPWGDVLAGTAVIGPALALTVWALWRRPALGFLGAAFFLALAPSSSLVPVASQVMAEHRVYLALAAVVTLVVLALHRWLDRRILFGVLAALVAAGAVGTVQRNTDYRSGLALWSATARDLPSNPRGLLNFGQALVAAGRWEEAAAQFEGALRVQPDYILAHFNLGLVHSHLRHWAEADADFATALRLNPGMTEAAYNWGTALAASGRTSEAVARYEYALRLDPGQAAAHYNLGNALVELGRTSDAIPHYREAVRLAPDHVAAHFNLGNAWAETGHYPEAATEYEAVLRLTPGDAEAARNLAVVREALASPAAR